MYKIMCPAIVSALAVALFILAVPLSLAQDPITAPSNINPTTQIWIALISGMISLVGTCFTAWIGLQTAKLNKKTDRIEAVATRAEGYANNTLGVQLDVNANLSRDKASKSGDAGDIKSAEIAEFKADSHRLEKERVESIMAAEKEKSKN